MTKLNVKVVAATLFLSMTSFTTKAEEASFDSTLAKLVVSQGKAVMGDLTTQLEQSIKASLSQFSIEQSVEFLQSTPQQVVSKEVEKTDKTSEE